MVSADTKSVIQRAKRIYADQLQTVLEARAGPSRRQVATHDHACSR